MNELMHGTKNKVHEIVSNYENHLNDYQKYCNSINDELCLESQASLVDSKEETKQDVENFISSSSGSGNEITAVVTDYISLIS